MTESDKPARSSWGSRQETERFIREHLQDAFEVVMEEEEF